MNRKQKKDLCRILAAAVLLAAARFLPLPGGAGLALYLTAYAVVGYDIVQKAVRGVIHGQMLDENFLMALATVGAFATGEFAEAVFVMLFYQVGELFQDYAVNRSRQSIAALMELRPDTADIEGEDGAVTTVDVEDVAVGQVMVVKPGSRLPLDGVVLSGVSALDTSALTGESLPRDVQAGDEVISGCVNVSGVLRIAVTKPCQESTVSKILELVENAAEKKAANEAFITRFARYYTPCVVAAALALFLLPTMALAAVPAASLPGFLHGTVWTQWLHRALIFLVISCPCALVISVPLSFFGGIGGASRCGILVKGGSCFELLAQADTVVFDKTGTLTRGHFCVTQVNAAKGFTKEELLSLAAGAEQFSTHPISRSLAEACPHLPTEVTQVEELAGCGVTAVVNGRRVAVGNRRLLTQQGIAVAENAPEGTVVFAAVDGVYAGAIVLTDLPKDGAREALAALKRCGVRRTVMLTGDSEAAAAAAAEALGVDEYHAGLLPADKVHRVEALLSRSRGKVVFVGDGINDAPVLARCDVGVAMGGLGSDAAIEAADVVLMDDNPAKVAAAIRISRKTLRIVRQNIVFALGVKALVLVLGATGHAGMALAVFADVGVAVLAILNAMRCLQAK